MVLGEKPPLGTDPQLFILPAKRELRAVILNYDSNIDFSRARKRREIVLQSHGGIFQASQSYNALYDLLLYVFPCPHRDLGWTHNIIAPMYNIGSVILDYDSNIDFSIALL